jgi:hypothetical protein
MTMNEGKNVIGSSLERLIYTVKPSRMAVETVSFGGLAALLTLVVGFAIGRFTAKDVRASKTPPPVECEERTVTVPLPPTDPRIEQIQRQRAVATRPVIEPRTDEAAQQLRRYERQQARDMIGLAMTRVAAAAKANPGDPEAAVAANYEYLAGWADGVIRNAPDLADELAAELETILCSDQVSAVQSLTASRMGLQMPELATTKSLDCVFKKQVEGSGKLKEDIVLWSALDTWRRSDLPKTSALEAVESAANDERTRRRFGSLQDERASRVAGLRAASEGEGAQADPQQSESPAPETH